MRHFYKILKHCVPFKRISVSDFKIKTSKFAEMMHKNRIEMDLETCCIGDLCTLHRNGIAWPIVYGIGVNVKTGDIFPAQFTDKGPDMDIRYARTLTGGDNVGVSL